MPFKGPYPTKFSGSTTAISVISGAFLSGGNIFDSGVIIGGIKVDVTRVNVFGDSSAGGGITNTGTISAAFNAIQLQSVATFAGAIVNGARLVAETGIHYGFFTVSQR